MVWSVQCLIFPGTNAKPKTLGLETVQARRDGDANEAEAIVALQMLSNLTRFLSKYKLQGD